jgi:hypothetical protein
MMKLQNLSGGVWFNVMDLREPELQLAMRFAACLGNIAAGSEQFVQWRVVDSHHGALWRWSFSTGWRATERATPEQTAVRDTPSGPERYCAHCRCWWPNDSEFFQARALLIKRGRGGVDSVCKGCASEYARSRRNRQTAPELAQPLRLAARPLAAVTQAVAP